MKGYCEIRKRDSFWLLKKRLETYARTEIKVGPSTKPRTEGGLYLTNAGLGLIHELDTHHWGFRSFLAYPLEYRLPDLFRGFELNDEMLWDSPDAFPKAIAARALEAVDEAFETEGWGRWQPLTETTILIERARKSPTPEHILMDTRQLRESITADIKQ